MTSETLWIAIGFLGQALFTSRFLNQWIASDRLGDYLRQRYPILQHQNALGAGVMAVSLIGMVVSGGLYLQGSIPAWGCILINALLTSFIHEIEHDLIHRLYFRKQPLAHNAMMLLCWLARPGMPSPCAQLGNPNQYSAPVAAIISAAPALNSTASR